MHNSCTYKQHTVDVIAQVPYRHSREQKSCHHMRNQRRVWHHCKQAQGCTHSDIEIQQQIHTVTYTVYSWRAWYWHVACHFLNITLTYNEMFFFLFFLLQTWYNYYRLLIGSATASNSTTVQHHCNSTTYLLWISRGYCSLCNVWLDCAVFNVPSNTV